MKKYYKGALQAQERKWISLQRKQKSDWTEIKKMIEKKTNKKVIMDKLYNLEEMTSLNLSDVCFDLLLYESNSMLSRSVELVIKQHSKLQSGLRLKPECGNKTEDEHQKKISETPQPSTRGQ